MGRRCGWGGEGVGWGGGEGVGGEVRVWGGEEMR